MKITAVVAFVALSAPSALAFVPVGQRVLSSSSWALASMMNGGRNIRTVPGTSPWGGIGVPPSGYGRSDASPYESPAMGPYDAPLIETRPYDAPVAPPPPSSSTSGSVALPKQTVVDAVPGDDASLAQRLESIEKRLDQVTRAIEEQTKFQRITYALSALNGSGLGGVGGRQSGQMRVRSTMTYELKEILYSFLIGKGHFLHPDSQARAHIVEELESLLGVKPRVTEEQGGYVAWYN